MGRILKTKELVNTRLATNYGGWMYCTNCNKNIGYLCYTTYDRLSLNYNCSCGSKGNVLLEFIDSKPGVLTDLKLITVKNRLCCPNDEAPLITMLSKNVVDYHFEITCKTCNKIYTH